MRLKRIAAAVIAAALAVNTTVFARYYKRTDIKPFDGKSIAYEPFDVKSSDTTIAEIRARISEPGHEDELKELLGELYKELLDVQYSAVSAGIISNKSYTDANVESYTKATGIAIDVIQKITDVLKEVYNTGYRPVLSEVLDVNDEELDELINTIPSERYFELMHEQKELEARYGDIYGDSDACAELYLELVKNRNEMAQGEGYADYADYAHTELFGRDYIDRIGGFSDAVATYLTPLMMALISTDMSIPDTYGSMTDDEIKKRVGSVMYSINGELGDSYKFMLDNDLYDIEIRDGKNRATGAYTTLLESKGVPYLFLNDELDDPWRIKTFIHESGHFCSLLNIPELDEPWAMFKYSLYEDTCEIHSQALELLAVGQYGRLFGADAANERFSTLATIVESVIDGCFYNEWQTRVYKEKTLTVDRANEIAAELMQKYYGVEDYKKSEAQRMWTSVPHNFVSPMYYLAYGVSAATALEIYTISLYDRDTAVDMYMRLSAEGGFLTFTEATEDLELNNIFDPKTVEKISQDIGGDCGYAYIDTSYDAWYANPLLATSHISDGRTEYLFAPEKPITRGEFVRLIGRMYDYYKGIDGEYTLTFEDVAPEGSEYIMWASANGIIDGYSDTEFGPDDAITREQISAILSRLYEYEGHGSEEDTVKAYFKDIADISPWAVRSVLWAVGKGLINGRDDNMLAPQDNTTRAEAVTLAARYIEKNY